MLRLANEARTAAGSPPLTCDRNATAAARGHSQDMCDNRYFSHTSLDGRRFTDRMREAGVRFGAGGENIARGQRTAASVHDAWMNSSGHRRNILNAAYRRLGVGHVACPGYGPVWTQNFAD
ncbi:MAG: CAP domain-containing protein [Sandaracinaceae bacterium]